MEVEKTFKIVITEEESREIETVEDVGKIIASKIWQEVSFFVENLSKRLEK